MSTNPEGRYLLQSTSEGFQNKVKDVFANLDSIADKTEKKKAEENNKKTNDEKKREKPRHYQHPNSRERSRSPPSRSKTLQDEFKGRESIFRTPNESGWPPSRSDQDRQRRPHRDRDQHRRRLPPKVPDHVINPNKYTKYDLSDVSKDQLSDRSNTRAAFDFLRNLKDKKSDAEEDNIADRKAHQEMVQDGKISFKKPMKKRNEEMAGASSSANVVHDGVKRVMPECVVGQKKPKSSDDNSIKKSKISTKNKQKSISLSHLDDEEEDDD